MAAGRSPVSGATCDGVTEPIVTLAHLSSLDLRMRRTGGMASGISMALRINSGCPRPSLTQPPSMPYPSRWILSWRFAPVRLAVSGDLSTAEHPAGTSAPCRRSFASFISSPCARSTPACGARATAPSPKCCSVSPARRRTGKSTRARTRPVAHGIKMMCGGHRLLLHYPIKINGH